MSYSSRVSTPELIDLSLSLVALIFAFSMFGERQLPSAETLVIAAAGVGTGFILHELAHKFAAQHYGYWAEYRASWSGLGLMIFMSLAMNFIFAAPGAVMIHKASSSLPVSSYSADPHSESFDETARREVLWISLAGPLTNIILTALFFMLLSSGALTDLLLVRAAYFAFIINLSLAAFNLLPFGPLDGAKIFQASRLVWAIVAVPTMLIALPVIVFGISIF